MTTPPITPAPSSKVRRIVGQLFAAEASSPAVHGALRALQMAVVSVAIAYLHSL